MVLLRRPRLEGLNEDFSGLFALLPALRGRQGPEGQHMDPVGMAASPPHLPGCHHHPSACAFQGKRITRVLFFFIVISTFCRGGVYLAGRIRLQLV